MGPESKSKKKKVSQTQQMRPRSQPQPLSQAHPLVVKVIETLRARGETLSCAESCTGGLLSAFLTTLPGVSDVYMGSVIAYSNRVKEDLLDVPPSLLRVVGAVSLPVAKSMATGVRKALGTTWALGITGIAGPGGGSPQKPVGTVCFGLSGPGVEWAEQHQLGGERREIQTTSVLKALEILLVQLDGARASSE